MLRARPNADCLNNKYKVEGGHLMIEAGQLPTLSTKRQPALEGSKGCQG